MARYPAKTFTRIPNRDFIISEANGTMSREQIMLYRGARIEPGTVLGKRTADGLYAPLNVGAADGTQVASAIIMDMRDALPGADTRRVAAIVRNADVNGKKLIWPAGITVNERKTAEGQLASTAVLVRY